MKILYYNLSLKLLYHNTWNHITNHLNSKLTKSVSNIIYLIICLLILYLIASKLIRQKNVYLKLIHLLFILHSYLLELILII